MSGLRRRQAAARALAQPGEGSRQCAALHEAFGPRNWRYSAQGTQALEPQSVYDNGKITSFAFVGNQEMPAIYMENSDGSESLVPEVGRWQSGDGSRDQPQVHPAPRQGCAVRFP